MLKFLMQLFGGNREGSSAVGMLAKDIREAIKGKEPRPHAAEEVFNSLRGKDGMD